MKYDVVSFCTPQVEILRRDRNVGLGEFGDMCGPWPSSDSCITIDQMARLGLKTAVFGAVGRDGFGECVAGRLRDDGVDASYIRAVEGENTAVSFYVEFTDGSREFLFNIRNSAARMLCKDDIDIDVLRDTKWLHISGFALTVSPSILEAVNYALDHISPETKVSFDPNYRREMLSPQEMREISMRMVERCNLFLPSEGEAAMYFPEMDDKQACRYLAGMGKIVAEKQGRAGSAIYYKDQEKFIPAFQVEVVSELGAGDSFGGAFLTALIEGKQPFEAAEFASAAAALTVGLFGPMSVPRRAQVDAFLRERAGKGLQNDLRAEN